MPAPLTTLALVAALQAPGEDLAERYPATLEWSQVGLGWESTPEDVWRLESFEIEVRKELRLAGGGADLVLGVHGRRDVLWAALFPDEPVEIETELPGGGERASAVFLRFSPYDVGRLFPKRTVAGPGSAWRRAEAARLFRGKLGWKWFTPSGNTTVVSRDYLIVDADTDAGVRRVYGADLGKRSVEYAAQFQDATLPPLPALTEAEAAAAYDAVVAAFQRDYAGFALLPDLEWEEAVAARRELAAAQRTNLGLGAVLADLLAGLEDLHAWVRVDGTYVPGYSRTRVLNGNWAADQERLEGMRGDGPNLWVARTQDNLGYLNVHGLADPELPGRVDAALEKLGDTWGLVLDLRYNGGGDEALAQQIAARFLDAEVVYAKHRFRGGPGLRELGPVNERTLAPRGPWRYAAPVVVLQGPLTMSSAEAFALMLAAAPDVTTLG
ncbi:MAG TPA: S41 family peptidase, partial [Planctomycetota bacterium]|nr:S41 family peptidase [Planctomycetota bacterium]